MASSSILQGRRRPRAGPFVHYARTANAVGNCRLGPRRATGAHGAAAQPSIFLLHQSSVILPILQLAGYTGELDMYASAIVIHAQAALASR